MPFDGYIVPPRSTSHFRQKQRGPVDYLLSRGYTVAGAWSTGRRLSRDYHGACYEARESGGGGLLDIGFNRLNEVDVNALAAHGGANECFVRTHYDQAPAANDFQETTDANQPRCMTSSGTFFRDSAGSPPMFNFDGVADRLTRADACGISGNSGVTLFYIVHTYETGRRFFEIGDNAGGGGLMAGLQGDNSWRFNNGYRDLAGDTQSYKQRTAYRASGANYGASVIRENGSALSESSSGSPSTTPNLQDEITCWGCDTTVSNFCDMDAGELILVDGLVSIDDVQVVERDQSFYWRT